MWQVIHTVLQNREKGYLTQNEGGRRWAGEEEVTLEMSHKNQYELELQDKREEEEVHPRQIALHVLIVVRW